jgi:predicted transcriptional regulator
LELHVLSLLDSQEGRGVADVQTALKRVGEDLAYTTVMTVLSRLYSKGHVTRVKEGRQFLYTVSAEREKVRRSLFERVRASVFRADRLKPILALLDSKEALSAEELAELKRVVDEKLKTARGKG